MKTKKSDFEIADEVTKGSAIIIFGSNKGLKKAIKEAGGLYEALKYFK